MEVGSVSSPHEGIGAVAVLSRKPQWAALSAVVLTASLLTGCGGSDESPTTLTYYIADAAQEDVANRCAAESGGAYSFDIQRLPNTAAGGRDRAIAERVQARLGAAL